MILGRSTQQITSKYDNVDFNISVESCGYVEMFVEATEELAALESAIYVADIMLEEHVLESADANVEVLLEGVVSSMYTRLKDTVERLWAKIKQWFANVKKFFQILFAQGKEFAKKYKTDIVKAEARAKGFTYEFYPVKSMGSIGNLAEKDGDIKTDADALSRAAGIAKGSGSNSENVKAYMKQNHWSGKESQAEFNKTLREELLGGEGKEEYTDFNGGPSVQEMLSLLETGGKTIELINKAEKNINTTCSKLIADLKKAENSAAEKVAKNPGSSLDGAYSVAVELTTAQANHGVAVCNTTKEVVKLLMRDSQSVLKRLLAHKPKKEGFEPEETDGHESILEAAFKLV